MSSPDEPAKVKVAVVEDKELLRELYAAVLEHARYEVRAFESGEALLEAGPRTFKVAVIDLQLGAGMHGVTLIRHIARDVRCIAITGSDPTLRSQALLTGAIVALPKPITNRSLVLAVELALAL